MEEMTIEETPGFLSRFKSIFTRTDVLEEDEVEAPVNNDRVGAAAAVQLRQNYRYTVTIRRQITSFDDAMAAANGLKRGEQQILNLSATDPTVRQKIVDFMCGVNFAQEGTWEEVGEHVYLIVPANAYVEIAPPTPRVNPLRN